MTDEDINFGAPLSVCFKLRGGSSIRQEELEELRREREEERRE
jgi:hypothetical protein